MPQLGYQIAAELPVARPARPRVLLIEDDAEIAQPLADCLVHAGYDVVVATDGDHGLAQSLSHGFDALIVDRMIPGIDGLTLVQRLRQAGYTTPALMLTALGRLQDRVDGLDAGADDYLVKPFAIAEMLARLRAVTRRAHGADAATRLVAGAITIDLVGRTVFRGETAILLQPREFRLLEELVRHAGTFVSRAMLLERVWNLHFDPQTKIVETHMSRVRAKLNAHGPDLIETARGQGYRVRIDRE